MRLPGKEKESEMRMSVKLTLAHLWCSGLPAASSAPPA